MTTALPIATAAPSRDTKESSGLELGRITPSTPKASGVDRAEPDWGGNYKKMDMLFKKAGKLNLGLIE